MDTTPSFELEIEKADLLFSFEIRAGYGHFYLHLDIWDFLLFHYVGRLYRCISMPCWWGRSPLWFKNMMRGFVQFGREKCRFLILPYMDDFWVATSPPGRATKETDASYAGKVLERLFEQLSWKRKVGKGSWVGSHTLDHLGVHIDTGGMGVYVSDEKVNQVRRLAKKTLILTQLNHRLMSEELLRHFCGVCISLSSTSSSLGFTRAAFSST